ncbi:hypothetical protein AAE478_008818 [Parahypoxylon ruwenzoriense]
MVGTTQLPSLITPFPEDVDWDTSVIPHEYSTMAAPERRHSGWDAVERKWTENEPHPAEPANPGPQRNLTMMKVREAMAMFPYPHMSLPSPQLKFDFRMKVILNSQSAPVATSDGFKKRTTSSGGMWSGCFGHGFVVSGEQDIWDSTHGNTIVNHLEATYRLQTKDDMPA